MEVNEPYKPCPNGHRFIYTATSTTLGPHDLMLCECGRWTYGELRQQEALLEDMERGLRPKRPMDNP